MIAGYNQSVFFLSNTTFVSIPSALSVFSTTSGKLAAAEYENYLFMSDGSAPPYKWNGTNFTRMGIPAPTSGPVAASQATGKLTGAYQYAVGFVNSGLVEGNVSPLSASFTAASATIRVSTIPVAPTSYGVTARRLYRYMAGQIDQLYRVATISDNTTTTYDDNIADADLGVEAPDDNGVPPPFSQIIYHRDRLFMIDPANPGKIYYTELGTPYVVGSQNFQTLGDNTGDLAQSLGVYNDSLIILCVRTPFALDMPSNDPAEWRIRELISPYGTKASRGVVKVDNTIMYPAVQSEKMMGFAAITGSGVQASTTSLRFSTAASYLKSDRVEPDMFQIPDGQIDEISAIAFQQRLYISVPYGTSQTTNNRIYVYDYGLDTSNENKGKWVPWTGLNAAMFTVYSGKLYYGDSNGVGFVYEMNKEGLANANDDGAAIDSYIYTKEFPGLKGEDNSTKDFRWANLYFALLGSINMQFGWKVDSEIGQGNTEDISLNPGGSLWGTMIWGIDSWGGGQTDRELRSYLLGVRGKRIQYYFNNKATVNQRFKIIGIDFRYNLCNER